MERQKAGRSKRKRVETWRERKKLGELRKGQQFQPEERGKKAEELWGEGQKEAWSSRRSRRVGEGE